MFNLLKGRLPKGVKHPARVMHLIYAIASATERPLLTHVELPVADPAPFWPADRLLLAGSGWTYLLEDLGSRTDHVGLVLGGQQAGHVKSLWAHGEALESLLAIQRHPAPPEMTACPLGQVPLVVMDATLSACRVLLPGGPERTQVLSACRFPGASPASAKDDEG